MNRDRTLHCCLCGELRRPTQQPVEGFSNSCRSITIGDHRPLQEGRWEISPQMVVSVSMWRNGGTAPGQTHICDGCIIVGLKEAQRFIDLSLAALSSNTNGSDRVFKESELRQLEVLTCSETSTVQFTCFDHSGDHPTAPSVALSVADAKDLASWILRKAPALSSNHRSPSQPDTGEST